MLKLRLQGTRKEIVSFIRMLRMTKRVIFLRISDLLEENNSDRYYHVYLEIRLVWDMGDDEQHENTRICKQFFKTGREQRSSGKNYGTGKRNGNVGRTANRMRAERRVPVGALLQTT